eukprot:gene8713-9644_t
MSRQVSPGSVRQGRSPARSANLRTSSVKNNNKSIVSPVRKTKDDSILIERDQGPKNTPQHLHGLDKAGDIIVILWLQSKPDSFQEMNSSGEDATVCLRSYNELRKKLQLAFELITESGKLFKQLERQTKHQHELIETKHNSLEYKIMLILADILTRQEFPVDLSEMHSLIEIALERYDADKIGIPDYALESAGGRIHVPYHSLTHSSGWPIMKVFGIVVWEDTRTPREVIKPENLPGNCWPLQGQKGYVTIKSWADEHGQQKTLLGSYIYNKHGKARQTFPIQLFLRLSEKNGEEDCNRIHKTSMISETAIEYVELRIGSNYGNTDFTCIYRFRVHGDTEGEKKLNPGT